METLIIEGAKTHYLIDENGNIYNTKTKKYLKGTIRSGYRMVKLTFNGLKKDYCIHRLVALTFLPNPENLPLVNHKDRNKMNNSVNNLEWVTSSDNILHAVNTGRKQRQLIKPIDEEISEANGWKLYKTTNYWFNKDGRGANIHTKKFLNTSINSDGYLRYYLYIDKQRIVKLAHRLIYETFFPDDVILQGELINHKDGNKTNNNITNLEKVTCKENMFHCYYILNKKVKSVCQYDLNNNFIQEYPSINMAARELNICDSGIVSACKGRCKTYKGFIWKYKEV